MGTNNELFGLGWAVRGTAVNSIKYGYCSSPGRMLVQALHKIDQCYSGWMEPYPITRSVFIKMMAVPAANGVYINLFNIGKTWGHCLQKYKHYIEKNRGPQRG